MKEEIFHDTAILIGGHALILGHKPEKLTMDQVQKKIEEEKMDFAKLGLFDTAAPNYTTYYPDVTEEDLNPTDDQFIEPVFRILSAVTVHKKWNPIYFPESVLKKTMYKLIGQTINVDHEMAVGNAVGSIKSVEWQNAYTIEGIKVPAGINGVLKIDGKANPRLARGIMMDPPSIHSASATVNFAWKKSHPKMDDNEFYNKLGTFGKDGKLIQRLVTDIAAYREMSLVSHGADPFAQKVQDGKIVNPKYAGSEYWSDATVNRVKEISNEAFVYDWKDCQSFSEGSIKTIDNTITIPHTINNNNDQNSENMEDLLKFLETFFGFEAESLTEDNYQEELGKIDFTAIKKAAEETDKPVKVLDLDGIEAIEKEVTVLRKFKKGVPENLEAQIALAVTGQAAIDELRAETKRLYGLTIEEGKEDATILALVEGADYKTLQSLHKQYDKITEGEFNFVCVECGSHKVTRASAKPGKPEDDHVTKSNQEVIEGFTGVNKVTLPKWMQQEEAK